MTPAKIVEEIIKLSVGEDNPQAPQTALALSYLNMAYVDLLKEVAKGNKNHTGTAQSVTLNVSGVGTLNPVPMRILSVQHTQSKNFLRPTDMVAAGQRFLNNPVSGNPDSYWIESTEDIHVQPTPPNSDTLLVQYIPVPAALTIDSLESDIKIPFWHHNTLVWGGMAFMANWERGFNYTQTVSIAEAKYEDGKRRLRDELYQEATSPIRTKTYY